LSHIAIKFLSDVWKEQCKKGDTVFLASKNRTTDKWRDFSFTYGTKLQAELKEWFSDNPSKSNDLYFCPLPFNGRKRDRNAVIRTHFLWQDLDYANPDYLDKTVTPTIAWESSPGRFQGLWRLDKHYDPSEIEELNRSLSRFTGADKGGWDLTQVLRIPGTHNNKYKEKPQVRFMYDNGIVYHVDKLKSIVDAPSEEDPPWDENHSALKEMDAQRILKKHHKKIPRKALTMLMAKTATMGKRSDIIWYLTNKLNEVGLNPHEIYSLMKASVWNKYKDRHDEEERLRTEIEKVIEGKFSDEPKGKTNPNPEPMGDSEDSGDAEDDDDGSFGLTLESYHEVMSSISAHPGWLVEGFWGRRSHGIVAGEPKSFKSTYVIDLAVSVASGEPFLGQYPVLEPGPVIYIQNENADWIIRDKVEKVIANRGLGGEAVYREKSNKLKVRFPKDLPLYFINQQGYQINDPIHQQILEKIIKQYKPVLIVLDPLYLMFDGDINSAKELMPALVWLLELKNKYKTGVMVIHHYNKGGTNSRGGQRMLGSTTLHGWIESAWYMKHLPKDDDEDEDDGDIAKVAGVPSPIILEREFRSAGGFPRLELTLTMGETGNPLYKVDVEKYNPKKGKEGYVSEDDVENDILNILEMSGRVVSQRKLADDTGASRRIIKKILDKLSEQGKVNLSSGGATII
jgi:hypothetical protein